MNNDFNKFTTKVNKSDNIENTRRIDISSDIDKKKSKEDIDKMIRKKNSQSNTYLFRIIWIVMIIFVSVLLTKYILVGINDMLAIKRPENTITIEIPENPSTFSVADVLFDAGAIKDKSFFRLYSFVTKSSHKFTQGKFEIKTNMDYEALINYIQSQTNRIDVVDVTFPEGLDVIRYANLLESKGICNADDFLAACNSNDFDEDYEFIKEIPNDGQRYYKLEGYLFPDTYKFYQGEDPLYTIRRFLNNYKNKIVAKKKVEGYDSNVSYEDLANEKGMTINDLLTLASIIQAESADEEDMYKVSSVLHNRLSTIDNGGVNEYSEAWADKLCCDSTIWYPYRSKEEVPEKERNKFESRYNTYDIIGLPPGPICNPGLTAIDAALNPADTNYYYFCHSNDKKAYYAVTINEHNINLAKAGLV